MDIRPIHDRIIVKRIEEDEVTEGGIVLPDTAREKSVAGEVIAVGPGKILNNGELRPMSINVGDTVLFGKYSGTEIKVKGEYVVVMREDDVVAVDAA